MNTKLSQDYITLELHKVLEKLRPLEQRMRYQLDKLLRRRLPALRVPTTR